MDLNAELLKFMILYLCLIALTTIAPSDAQVIKPECQQSCGNVSIPYPFGTREGCYLNTSYLVTCNETFSPPQLFLRRSLIPVTDISISGELRVLLYIAYDCYYSNGTRERFNSRVTLSKFPFSSTRNKFVAFGCDTYAIISGASEQAVRTGCLSVCQNLASVTNGTCSGRGCCQTLIPNGVLNYNVTIKSYNNHLGISDFNPCSYSFLAEENSFTFSKDYLSSFNKTQFPVILDWDIGDQRCAAVQNTSAYACREPSTCHDSENGPGYRCNCSSGYAGNPYLQGGCKDINECERDLHNCQKKDYCNNTVGHYECRCPKGYHGNGTKDEPCVAKDRSKLVILITIGVGVGGIVLLMCANCLYLASKKRKLFELKRKFFEQNGGSILQELRQREGYSEAVKAVKIFTAEELEKATNMYDKERVIGRGGFGTVYKGILEPDNKFVAIKKSKLVDESQIEQFINEILVLSQVNHRNVVKLLGCCLETQVPLLVYEFVSNGTVFDHIHGKTSLSWETRLRIGAETAGVLGYLHSSASPPIIHRDVKSANILLDENLVAKVADFGASRLVPLNQAELSTVVQGTIGYLDPEYLQTSQLTEKSDVYSFGMVLVELLTGRKPHMKESCLANFFLASFREDRLFQILADVSKEANPEQVQEVANIAKRCLSVKGDDRPTMNEVAMELEGIRVMAKQKHSRANGETNLEENESLLGNVRDISTFNVEISNSVNNSFPYDSIRNHVMVTVGDGR